MSGKLIGAFLIIFSCGGFGFAIAASYRREETSLRQMIGALDFMQCELQFRLTPLPELCRQAGLEQHGQVGDFLSGLAAELDSQIAPDVSSCMAAAFAKTPSLSPRIRKGFELLGTSLGRFDTEGQIVGLESVRSYCRRELDSMAHNRDSRLRSYQTLGICAGAAIAILFV